MTSADSGAEPASRGPLSNWALGSLLCSIGFCCPAMSALAILFGLRAVLEIKAAPASRTVRGWNMAMAGVTLGVLGTMAWIGVFIWWHFNARLPMLHGPREELRAGFADDLDRFRDGFVGEGAMASDAEVRQFLDTLTARYGRFVDSAQSATATRPAPLAGPTEYPIAYSFRFSGATVEGEAMFVTFAPAQAVPSPIFKWRWLQIFDAHHGDLLYPAGSNLPPPVPMSSSP